MRTVWWSDCEKPSAVTTRRLQDALARRDVVRDTCRRAPGTARARPRSCRRCRRSAGSRRGARRSAASRDRSGRARASAVAVQAAAEEAGELPVEARVRRRQVEGRAGQPQVDVLQRQQRAGRLLDVARPCPRWRGAVLRAGGCRSPGSRRAGRRARRRPAAPRHERAAASAATHRDIASRIHRVPPACSPSCQVPVQRLVHLRQVGAAPARCAALVERADLQQPELAVDEGELHVGRGRLAVARRAAGTFAGSRRRTRSAAATSPGVQQRLGARRRQLCDAARRLRHHAARARWPSAIRRTPPVARSMRTDSAAWPSTAPPTPSLTATDRTLRSPVSTSWVIITPEMSDGTVRSSSTAG